MTEPRICAYQPCSASFASSHPKARYCSDPCRTRDWKRKAFYGAARSVRTDGSSRSGPQLSYRKAVEAVTALVRRIDPDLAAAPNFVEHVVEAALLDALPARQRERLVSATPDHHVDHREEAVGYLNAAWERGQESDGTDRAIPIQQAAAITHAILYVGDELRALREGAMQTGGVSLADAIAEAVDHATTEVANAARSFAEHGGGWRGR